MKLQKQLTWITAFIENVLFSGVTYGWANLYPVLKDEQFFAEDYNFTTYKSTRNNSFVQSSYDQYETLTLVFIISVSVSMFSVLFIGLIFDKLGMWFVRALLTNSAAAAMFLLASISHKTSFLLYLVFPVFATCSFNIFILNAQVANLFEKNRGSYTASLAGAFNSGSVVYLFISYIYYNYKIKFSTIIYFYACFLITLNFRTFLLVPKYPVPFALPETYFYGYYELLKQVTNRKINKNLQMSSSDSFNPDNMKLRQTMKKAFFWIGILCAVSFAFISNFYISILNIFLPWVIQSSELEDVKYYTNIMGIIQASSFIFSFINSILLDLLYKKILKKYNNESALLMTSSVGFYTSLSVLLLLNIANLVRHASVQIFAMLMHAISRVWFAGAFQYYCSALYPSQHFGKLYGISMIFCGTVNTIQYPITRYVTKNPENNFIVINGFLVGFCIVGFIHPSYLLHRYFKKQKCILKKRRADQSLVIVNSINVNTT